MANAALIAAQAFLRVLREETGATAVEYTLVAALIALAIVTAVGNVGTEVQRLWDGVADDMNKAVNNPSGTN